MKWKCYSIYVSLMFCRIQIKWFKRKRTTFAFGICVANEKVIWLGYVSCFHEWSNRIESNRIFSSVPSIPREAHFTWHLSIYVLYTIHKILSRAALSPFLRISKLNMHARMDVCMPIAYNLKYRHITQCVVCAVQYLWAYNLYSCQIIQYRITDF